MLEKLANTLTTDDKYYLLSRDNFRQPIQMDLWKKENKISNFFSAFWKSNINFEHF